MNIYKLSNYIPNISKYKTIGILGGSFDPPHLSHTLMAIYMLLLKNIDELWIIPCFNHAFGKKLSSFSVRINMCKLAFSYFGDQIKIVSIEKYLSCPNYTVRTLELIKKINSEIKIFFAIGSDSLQKIHKWRDFRLLRKLCTLIVFLRIGFPMENISYNLVINKIENYILPNISSSAIRNMCNITDEYNIKNNLKFILDNKVLKFIKKYKIYYN